MTVVNHVLNRIHVQRLLLAAALLGVSLSASANFIARTTHGNFEIVKNGKSTELRPPQTALGNGNAVASAGTVTQGMGATAAGPTAASGVNMAGTTTVPVNGSNVAAAVKTNIGSEVLIPAALSGLGCVQGGVVGVVSCAAVGAAVAAAPLAYNWLTRAGGRIDPATNQLQVKDPAKCFTAPCYSYSVGRANNWPTEPVLYQWYPDTVSACPAGYKFNQPGGTNTIVLQGAAPRALDGAIACIYKFWSGYNANTSSGGSLAANGYSFATQVRSPDTDGWLPASMNDIAGYMRNAAVDPGIVNELTNLGQNLGNPPLTVTGPASVPGQATSTTTNNTTNNTSTTTTNTTTNNYTYEGNKVTNISTSITTVTTTKNPDGTTTTTGTGTTTTTPGEPTQPEDPKVQCDKYPNSLGCAELDTPDAEIPKDTKNVGFTAEDPFGGGKCPADVMASFRAIGNQSLKIVDWTTFCGMALPLRGLVLALASIMAFFIIMPGGVRE